MAHPDFEEYFALREKGAFGEAYAALCEVLENSPRWAAVGDLYVWCAEFELLLNDDLRKAKDLLDKARELGCRQEAQYYREHGYVLWRLGEREKGIAELEHCVELDPSRVYLVTLGKVLSTDGDERALAIWQRVLDEDPEDCLAHIYLGIEAANAGDRGRALLMARRAENLNPTARDMHEIGTLYGVLGLFQEALDSYLAADKMGYELKGSLYACVAECYFCLGQARTGRKYMEWALQRSPENDYVKDRYEKRRELMSEDLGD